MKDKNILVTGASRGLGRTVAEELWRRGANLALVARSCANLESLAADLQPQEGRELHLLPADLLDPRSPQRLIRELRQRWPRLDGLVNNAAIVGPVGPLWESDWQQWRDTIQVNLLAPADLCRLCLPWMADGGSIVNLSGGGAASPRPNFSAYAAAKTGIVRLTETLALETSARGIRVNAVAPGAMNTAMLEAVLIAGPSRAGGEYQRALEQKQKGGAPLETAASLIAWLLSDESRSITGRLISAVWDPWRDLANFGKDLPGSDIYTLRRITPENRGLSRQ